jgi:streptogramin lyase
VFHKASIFGPIGIASGPDGALWFTNAVGNSIGRITTSGTVTNFTDPTISQPEAIVAGPDDALWFTNAVGNSIGRITTAGVVTNFTDPTISGPSGIAVGADGALWFTNGGSIGRITTTGVVTIFADESISVPIGITPGPDGALWFTNQFNNSIGRITTSGVVSNFGDSSIAKPRSIAPGPDGALWFTNFANDSIGRITTAGVVTNFTDPSLSDPWGITAGPGGALWFVNNGNESVGRITTSGTVTNYAMPGRSFPAGITWGPDGALWFTVFTNNEIVRLGSPKPKDACSGLQSCLATVNASASASTPRVSVVVTGQPVGTPGTVELKLALGTLACPTVPPDKRVVGTLTNTGFSKNTKLRLTVTLRHTTGTTPAQVCFKKDAPFKSKTPSTSGPNGGTGFLLTCAAAKNVAPCVLSSKAVGTSVVVTFVVPGGDPDFSIQWPAGGRQSWLSQFGQGTVGKRYKAQLQVKGGVAPYRWKMTSGTLPKGVKLNASTGLISGTPGAKGKFPIVVQATDAQNPAKKTKPEKVPIVINPRP